MEPGPSILNMAEAMLQNNEYKTSHTSLNDFADESDNKDMIKGDTDIAMDNSTIEKRNDDEEKLSPREKSNGDKKSEGRSVVIQVPPKRRKISTPFTPKEVVDGTSVVLLWMIRRISQTQSISLVCSSVEYKYVYGRTFGFHI